MLRFLTIGAFSRYSPTSPSADTWVPDTDPDAVRVLLPQTRSGHDTLANAIAWPSRKEIWIEDDAGTVLSVVGFLPSAAFARLHRS